MLRELKWSLLKASPIVSAMIDALEEMLTDEERGVFVNSLVVDTRNMTVDACREKMLETLRGEAWRCAVLWVHARESGSPPSVCNAQLGAALWAQAAVELVETDGGIEVSLFAMGEDARGYLRPVELAPAGELV